MTGAPRLALVVVVVVVAAACASDVARPAATVKPIVAAFGDDAGRGNLLGVQPWLTPLDYATPGRLDHKLRGLLDEAKARGLLGPRTVVVFPEYMGAWLVGVDEGRGVLEAAHIASAMRSLAAAHPIDFAAAALGAPAHDAMAYAAFAVKARRMAQVHEQIFSAIARDYEVTVAGASTLLPGAVVEGGHIAVTPGAPLQNVAFLFHPDGTVDPQVARKAFPTADERPFVAAAAVGDLPVYDTPAGALGVVICADSWFPQTYDVLHDKGAALIAVPVFIDGDWDLPWKGYSGQPAPHDVDAHDVGALTEREAWAKYALPGRANVDKALLVPLRGALWDLRDSGRPLVVNGAARDAGPEADGPLLVSLWL